MLQTKDVTGRGDGAVAKWARLWRTTQLLMNIPDEAVKVIAYCYRIGAAGYRAVGAQWLLELAMLPSVGHSFG